MSARFQGMSLFSFLRRGCRPEINDEAELEALLLGLARVEKMSLFNEEAPLSSCKAQSRAFRTPESDAPDRAA